MDHRNRSGDSVRDAPCVRQHRLGLVLDTLAYLDWCGHRVCGQSFEAPMTHHCFAALPAPSLEFSRCPDFPQSRATKSERDARFATMRAFLTERGYWGARVWELAAALDPDPERCHGLTNWFERQASFGYLGRRGIVARHHQGPRQGGRIYYLAELAEQLDGERRTCLECAQALPRTAFALAEGSAALHDVCHACESARGYAAHVAARKRYRDRVTDGTESRNAKDYRRPYVPVKRCPDCAGLPHRRIGVCAGCGKRYAPEPPVELDPTRGMGCQSWCGE